MYVACLEKQIKKKIAVVGYGLVLRRFRSLKDFRFAYESDWDLIYCLFVSSNHI